eukprot:COSAG05_NODE_5693_length_1114_cov_1.361576_2_plen_96_part_00
MMQAWEKVIMANPSALARATAECTKTISLIARQLGVPSAGTPHPDPEKEARRTQERKGARLFGCLSLSLLQCLVFSYLFFLSPFLSVAFCLFMGS